MTEFPAFTIFMVMNAEQKAGKARKKQRKPYKSTSTHDVGRPGGLPIYKPETFPKLAYEYALQGIPCNMMSSKFGVSRKTFYLWRQEHPEFEDELRRGMDEFDCTYVEKYHELTMGKMDENKYPEARRKAIEWWLAHRQPDDFDPTQRIQMVTKSPAQLAFEMRQARMQKENEEAEAANKKAK